MGVKPQEVAGIDWIPGIAAGKTRLRLYRRKRGEVQPLRRSILKAESCPVESTPPDVLLLETEIDGEGNDESNDSLPYCVCQCQYCRR
jgi:hypothetical protein